MDVLSAINETISLFNTIRELCRSVTQRIDNFKDNPEELQVVREGLSSAQTKIDICKRTLEKYGKAVTIGSLEFELAELQSIMRTMQHAQKSIEELEKKLQQRRRFKRFFRANKIAEDISQQMDVIRNMTSQVSEINQKLEEIAQQNDLFTPDFSSIPKVLVPVHLDFSTTQTVEGEVKARVLESVERSAGNKENIQANVTAVVGVEGMGGVGKTTALIGLARDPDIRDNFSSGGIYFLVVGKDATEANLIAKLKDIVSCSGGMRWCDNIDSNGSLESAARKTSAWFAKRKALFICDDLWQISSCETGYFGALMGLLDGSPESHMLISTRSSAIASESYASIQFGPRTDTGYEARGMLLKSAGLDETMLREDGCEEQVRQVLELCGGVPLMLSIAGAQVRKRRGATKTSLDRLLHSLKDERLSLQEKRHGQYMSCFNQAVKSSLRNIAEILESSEGFLDRWVEYSRSDDTEVESSVSSFVINCFHALCVLPRSARVPENIILGAWRINSKKLGWSVIDSLVDFHLLLEFEDAQGTLHFGLHDVLLDYCEKASQSGPDPMYNVYHNHFLSHVWKLCHQESSSTFDMEGKWDDRTETLDTFWIPEAYANCRPWWRVLLSLDRSSEVRNYLLGNLFRHLRESGGLAEAVGLLSHMGWTNLRVAHGGIVALNTDYSVVDRAILMHHHLHHAEQDQNACNDARCGIRSIWDMIKRAWPWILKNSQALPTHAYGYLVDKKERMPLVQRYLESAVEIVSGPWLKPENAFWSMLDSSSSGQVFRTGEEIVDIVMMMQTKNVIVATPKMLFWIDIETMTTTKEMVIRNENQGESRICAFAYCEAKGIIVLGFSTKELEIRNERNGEVLKTVPDAHHDSVKCVAISGDGRTIVFGSSDNTVRVWNTENGTIVGQPLRSHDDFVNCVTISGDGRTIVSGSLDKTVRVWNTENGKVLGSPLGDHESSVECVAISGDGRTIVSGSLDDTVRVWNTETGTLIGQPLRGHEYSVECVAVSGDGRTIVSGSLDNTVRVWNTETGTLIGQPLRGHDGLVSCVAISWDGRTIVSGSFDETVRVWNTETGTISSQPLRSHEEAEKCVAISGDGRTIVSGSFDNTVRVWNNETGEIFGQPFRGHGDIVECVATNGDARTIVSGSRDDTVRVWNTETGEIIGQPLRGHDDWVKCIAISRDGRTIVSGSFDNTVRVWSIETGTIIGQPLRGHDDFVKCVAISGDGRTIVSGSFDKTVRVWNIETGLIIGKSLRGHDDSVQCVAISGDGRTIVSGSGDDTMRVWNTETGLIIGQPLRGHNNRAACVSISEDGRTIVSGSWDSTLQVWCAVTGIASEESSLPGHSLQTTNVHVGSTHRTSASASIDNSTRMLQAEKPLRYHNYYTVVLPSWAWQVVYNDFNLREGQRPRVICPIGATRSVSFELIEPNKEATE